MKTTYHIQIKYQKINKEQIAQIYLEQKILYFFPIFQIC